MYATDRPQVVTTNASDDRISAKWLGALGNVNGLGYGFTFSGGSAAMACTLVKPSKYRTNAIDPGRYTRIVSGGSVIWTGVLEEPQHSDSGWQLTANGTGRLGDDYMAIYDVWNDNPDDAVSKAITRGLPWVNPGIGAPDGMWLGQRVDPGSQSITDLLNLVCTRGGLAWYVNPKQGGNRLSVVPLPDQPSRMLVAGSPVARTLGGDLNVIWIRYQDPSPLTFPQAGPGTIIKIRNGPHYVTTSVTDQASVDRHGRLETFMDLSSAGKMTAAQARAVGQHVLNRYQRASFAGPFTIVPGQLLNMGGTPVDLAMERASATVCKLLLTDFGYGGEVLPRSPQFIVGEYAYDVETQTAQVTPMQTIRASFADLIAEVTGEPGHRAGTWQRR